MVHRYGSVDRLFPVLISQVVVLDAYSPGDDRVLHRDNASRLTKDVEKATGLRTGRRYRRWYEREGALEASVGQARPGHRHRDRHDDDQLVCKQSGYINGGRSRRASLKSSGHHDALEATGHDRTSEEIRGIKQQLGSTVDLPVRVQYLAPVGCATSTP